MGKIILNGKEYVTSTTRGFPPLIYSDDEREVGVWRDGKPLYQKSFTGTSSDITFQISISSLNVDRFVDGQISIVASGGSVKSIVYFANSTDLTRIWISGSNLNVEIGSNYPARPINYVATILYTKTTDTAGSGKYSAVSDLSHHYSTTEQVVGTWIDGSTIYETSYELTSAKTLSGSWSHSDIVIDNISKVIRVVTALDADGQTVPLVIGLYSGYELALAYCGGPNNLLKYFTIQYTKSSS